MLVAFNSSHAAIALEKSVIEAGIKGRLVGTPERISASCGLTLKTNLDNLTKVKHLIEKIGIMKDVQFYQVIEEAGKISYQEIE